MNDDEDDFHSRAERKEYGTILTPILMVLVPFFVLVIVILATGG